MFFVAKTVITHFFSFLNNFVYEVVSSLRWCTLSSQWRRNDMKDKIVSPTKLNKRYEHSFLCIRNKNILWERKGNFLRSRNYSEILRRSYTKICKLFSSNLQSLYSFISDQRDEKKFHKGKQFAVLMENRHYYYFFWHNNGREYCGI